MVITLHCEISGFWHGVDKFFALLGSYTAYVDRRIFLDCWTLEDGTAAKMSLKSSLTLYRAMNFIWG